jgi:hypothetical protein
MTSRMRALAATTAIWIASVGAFACTSGAAPSTPPPAAPAAQVGSDERAATPRSRRAPAWAIAYERECRGSITPPRIAPSSNIFTLCDAAFELESGAFRSNVPIGLLALLDDRLALFDDHSDGGLVLAAIDDLEGHSVRRAEGGSPAMVALSLDGKRAATLEDGQPSWELVVRELSSLRALSRTSLESYGTDDLVAFIDAGDPIVLTDRDCRRVECGQQCERRECRSRGLFRATPAGLVSLGPRFDRVARMSASSRRALIVRDDGQREIVALPDGKPILSLPPLPRDADEEAHAIAIDPGGERFAYVDAGLRIAKLAGGRAIELHHAPALNPTSLFFSTDGKWLLAALADDVAVLHEGARPKPVLPPTYSVPANVRAGLLVLSALEPSDELGSAHQIRQFVSDDGSVDVSVFASDPAELGHDRGTSRWTRAALDRYEGGAEGLARVKSWTRGQLRSLEYASFVRQGCEPVDRYVRITEKDGIVYRVVVEVPPGSERAFVQPLLQRFFDQPLGAPPAER